MSLSCHLDDLTLRGTSGNMIVRGLSLSIGAGEVVALTGEIEELGEALARVMIRAKRPYSGCVVVEGAPLHRIKQNDWLRLRPRIAVWRALDEAPLNPRRPVVDALAEPLDVQLPRLNADERQAMVGEAVKRSGLDPKCLPALPAALSDLQCQQVALARTVVTAAELILAVEPFRGLDPTARARLMNRMMAASMDHQTGWLLLSRDLAEAGHLARRIGVLRDGQMVEYGDADELLLTPRHAYTQLLVNMRPDLMGGDFDHPRPPAPLPPAGEPILRLPAPASEGA
ncbi:MAG: ATP-binding cassette domain-containing protein [Pseudomonadota bacterium]